MITWYKVIEHNHNDSCGDRITETFKTKKGAEKWIKAFIEKHKYGSFEIIKIYKIK